MKKKKWISINKKLPPLYKRVEVKTKYGKIKIAWRPDPNHSLFFYTLDKKYKDGKIPLWAGPVKWWREIK